MDGRRIVIGDAFGDNVGGDVERGSDGGGASHVGDDGLAGEEAGGGEARGAEGEICLGAFFVELGGVDAEGGGASAAVGEGVFGAREAGEGGEISIVFIEHDDPWRHLEEGGLGGGELLWRGGGEAGGEKICECGDLDGEPVEDVVFERLRGSGDDAEIRAGFPGVGEELVQNGKLERGVGGEDGDVLAGGAENLMHKMGDGGLARGAGDADELHIADGIAIIAREELCAGALGLGFEGGLFFFCFLFWFRGLGRLRFHEVIIA